ncbi:MAG TPA: hypothetical protein VGE74_04050, partial [Gemmata sp.]
MGFLSGGITFQRFRASGPKPNLVDKGEAYVARLRDRRADQHRPPDADGTCVGWAAGASVLDTDFSLMKQVYTDHLVWDFWTQTNRLPGDRLNAYYQADLAALARDNPSGYASARQKREAKSSARARLEQEARDGRFKKWKATPCLWDGITNAVLFGATSCGLAGRFVGLFEQTFDSSLLDPDKLGGKLSAVTPATLAEAYNPAAKNEALTNFWGWDSPCEAPSWCPLDNSPEFLGNEFLLWLWYFTDKVSDTVKLADGTEATLMFAGGLQVEDPRGHSGRGTLNSMSAVKLPEARAAVRSGKLPRKAALTVVRQGEQFTFVIQA